MKRLLILAGFALARLPVEGQACAGFGSVAVKPYAYEAITVSSTSIGFTAAQIDTGSSQAVMAVCMLETDNIRIRADGGVPTSSVGQLVTQASNVSITVCGQSAVKAFRAIRTSTDASLKCQYLAAGN